MAGVMRRGKECQEHADKLHAQCSHNTRVYLSDIHFRSVVICKPKFFFSIARRFVWSATVHCLPFN